MTARTFHPLPKRPVASFGAAPPPQHVPPPHAPMAPGASTLTAQSHTRGSPQQHQRHNPPQLHSHSQPQSQPQLPSPQALAPPTPATAPSVLSGFSVPLPPPLTTDTEILGSKLALDSSFHISRSLYHGDSLALERLREYVVSTWKDDPDDILKALLVTVDDSGLCLYKYDDVLADLDLPSEHDVQPISGSTHALSGANLHPDARDGFLRALRSRILHYLEHTKRRSYLRVKQCTTDSVVIYPPQVSPQTEEWGAGWDPDGERPLLQIHVYLHIMHNQPSVHILYKPTLSSLYLPSERHPLEAHTRVRLTPHGTPAIYLGPYVPPPQEGYLSSLQDEFRRSLSFVDNEDVGEMVRVWIPLKSAQQSEEIGVEVVYPRCCVLVQDPSAEGQSRVSHDLPEPTVSISERAKEIGAFVDAVVRERDRAKGRMTHARKASQNRISKTDEMDVDEKKDVLSSHPAKRQPEVSQAVDKPTSTSPANAPPRMASPVSPESRPQALPEQRQQSPQPTKPASRTSDVDVPQSRPSSSQGSKPKSDTTVTPSRSRSNTITRQWNRSRSNTWSEMDFDMLHQKRPSSVAGMSMDEHEGGFAFTEDDFSFFEGPAIVAESASVGAGVGAMHVDDEETNDCIAIDDALRQDTVHDPGGGGAHVDSEDGPEEILTPPEAPHASGGGDSVHIIPATSTGFPFPTQGPGMFDPIDFGDSWQIGRNYTSVGSHLHSHDAGIDESWRAMYEERTDPKYGIMKMLRSVKPSDAAKQVHKFCWSDNADNWESTGGASSQSTPEAIPDVEDSSDSDTDDTDSEMLELDGSSDFDDIFDEQAQPHVIPLDELPLGPVALHSRFSYAALKPLASATTFHNSPTPISAPTPVSPGANSADRIKGLEPIANMLAKEIIGSNFFSSLLERTNHNRFGYEVGRADFKCVKKLTSDIGVRLSLNDVSAKPQPKNALADSLPGLKGKAIDCFKQPHITIAHAKTRRIMHVVPPALNYWEKLGLAPKSGPKDIVAYVVHENVEGRDGKTWLELFGRVYSMRAFGKCRIGKGVGVSDGVFPVQRETWRKSLGSLLSSLNATKREPNREQTVVFIAFPESLATLTSPTFRQLILFIQKCSTSSTGVLFHFIPEREMVPCITYPRSRHGGLEHIAIAVYDRLLYTAVRIMSRSLFRHGFPISERFQRPAFTLSRMDLVFRLTIKVPSPSLDVLDRHMILHVVYAYSKCGRWVAACIVDQYGEAYDTRVFACAEDDEESENQTAESAIIYKVWSFAIEFASRADIEWRIVISKVGLMCYPELNTWHQAVTSTFTANPNWHMHVSFTCLRTDLPWQFIFESKPKQAGPTVLHGKAVFTDISCISYALQAAPGTHIFLPESAPLASEIPEDPPPPPLPEASTPPASASLIRVPTCSSTAPSVIVIHLLYTLRSAHSKMQKDSNELLTDIVRNFHELAHLTASRWEQSYDSRPVLPYHLAAVSNILTCLETLTDA